MNVRQTASGNLFSRPESIGLSQLLDHSDSTDKTSGAAIGALAARVWIIELTCSDEQVRAARSLLDASELARCERVIDPLRRQRLLLAHAALRSILGAQLRLDPGRVKIVRSAGGRPLLADESAVSFSLSHSDKWASVAVSTRARVGIDIEAATRQVSDAMLRRLLTPREANSVLGLKPSSRSRAFLEHWTIKEACAKVLDGGLAHNLSRLELEDFQSESPRLLDRRLADLEVLRVDCGQALVCALAARPDRPEPSEASE